MNEVFTIAGSSKFLPARKVPCSVNKWTDILLFECVKGALNPNFLNLTITRREKFLL